ncbi:hypothetical protein [Thiomicrospira sp. WB1]|uniref:hypothetical protein n=1 Tax=Thiomicrospira sp. WB1 TaxID=1685380 RepID=UPI00074769C9|nr:hypothetical protein [Thiomicrospira sp. WB1]KUJ72467.1 hypothetical protein AVO41_01250 [Thiomicrospira sp. WB1]
MPEHFPTFTTLMACDAHAKAVTALFSETFEAQVPDSWWNWKYGGRDIKGAVSMTQDDEVIAFYGSLSRQAMWQGRFYDVSQQADVMVAQPYRYGTRQSGPFVKTSCYFLHRCVGENKPFATAFGFPTPRALTLGRRLELYRQSQPFYEWSMDADKIPKPQRFFSGRGEMEDPARGAVEELAKHAHALPRESEDCFVLVRHASYWHWRFWAHPQHAYRLLVVRRFGRSYAAMVVREHAHALEVMDFLAPSSKAVARLMRWAGLWARKLNKDKVMGLATQAVLESLPDWGATCSTIFGHIALPHASIEDQLTSKIDGHLWLTGGDTDFR